MVVYFELVPGHEYLAKYLTNSTSANLAKCLAFCFQHIRLFSIQAYQPVYTSSYIFKCIVGKNH